MEGEKPKVKNRKITLEPLKGVKDAKLNYFNGVLWYSNDKKKKIPHNPEGYTESTFIMPLFIDETTEEGKPKINNALCLLMGQKINDKYLICIDIDDKEEQNVNNGLSVWKELIKQQKYKPNTPRATTPSGGLHYFYTIDENTFNKLGGSQTKIFINGSKCSIDTKINNQYIYVEPTYYYKNNEIQKYKFTNDNFNKIEQCPEFIVKILTEQPNNKHTILNNKIKNIKDIEIKQEITEATEEEKKIIKICLDNININKCLGKNFINLLNIGKCLYFLGCSFEFFENWVNDSIKNYENKKAQFNLKYKWSKFNNVQNIYNNFGIKKLFFFVYDHNNKEKANKIKEEAYKNDNFKNILLNIKLENMNIEDIYNNGVNYLSLNIESEFLLKQDEKLTKIYKQPKNDQERMNNYLLEFIENKKAMIIKSHLGSGKTQAIIKVLQYLQQQKNTNLKCIFITHRQSLAYDIENNFNKLGFKNYLNKDEGNEIYTADKIICSLESLHKINTAYTEQDEKPYYDVVILDEIESLLYHIKSKTHNDNNMRNFLLLFNLCKGSKKTLALDGDICPRSLNFINSITDNYIYVKNSYQTNKKHHIYEDVEEFNIKYIKTDENKYIFSMESNTAQHYEEEIKKEKPDRKVLKIIGDMDDNKKKEIFKNVNEEFTKYNDIITTSTTEAGVNYDPKTPDNFTLKHFDKILCILGSSISQRQLKQGLARVRNPKDKDNIYYHTNGKYKYTRNYNFTTYEDLKDISHYYELDNTFKNLEGYEAYKQNCIFNDVEERNKEKNFIEYYELLLKETGGNIIYYEKQNKDNKKKVETKNYKIDNVITASFIYDVDKRNKLMRNKELNKATEKDKYDIKKTLFLRKFYFNKKEIEVIETHINKDDKENDNENENENKNEDEKYNEQLFNNFFEMLKAHINNDVSKNFMFIVDEDNYNKKLINGEWKDRQKDINDKTANKIKAIKELMKLFNVENPTETKELINFNDVLRNNFNKMKFYIDKAIYKEKYNMLETGKGKESLQPVLTYINGLLNNFGLNIKTETGKRIQKNKKREYEPSKYYIQPLEVVELVLKNKMRNLTLNKNKTKNPNFNDIKNFLSKYIPEIQEPNIFDVFDINEYSEDTEEQILYKNE